MKINEISSSEVMKSGPNNPENIVSIMSMQSSPPYAGVSHKFVHSTIYY